MRVFEDRSVCMGPIKAVIRLVVIDGKSSYFWVLPKGKLFLAYLIYFMNCTMHCTILCIVSLIPFLPINNNVVVVVVYYTLHCLSFFIGVSLPLIYGMLMLCVLYSTHCVGKT